MKLFIQIALGVFLGTISAQLVLDRWHEFKRKQENAMAQHQLLEKEKARLAQADRIRAMLLQKRGDKTFGQSSLPPGFVPDDAIMQPDNKQSP